jgi:hypothetical protein
MPGTRRRSLSPRSRKLFDRLSTLPPELLNIIRDEAVPNKNVGTMLRMETSRIVNPKGSPSNAPTSAILKTECDHLWVFQLLQYDHSFCAAVQSKQPLN